METKKPLGYENYLSGYQMVLVDGWCGEPVAWGFKIIHYLGDDLFNKLGQHGKLHCVQPGSWVLIKKTLTRQEALEKYGAITEEIYGPRGGWKSVTFGEKKFISPYLKSKKD